MNRYLYCSDFIEDEDYVWFSSNDHNGFYQIDKDKKRVELLSRFPGEKVLAKNLYSKMLRWEGQFIFVPCAANEIAIYDHGFGMKKIPLKDMRKEKDDLICEKMKFMSANLYENDLWLWGTGYPAIVCLDLLTEEVTYYTEWRKWTDYRADNHAFFTNAVIRGKEAYIPCFSDGAVLKIDLDTQFMERILVPLRGVGLYWVSDDGTNLWMIAQDSRSVVRWDSDTGAVEEIKLPYNENRPITPFYCPLIDQEKVYLFPWECRDVYLIDRKTNIVSKEEKLTELLGIGEKRITGIYETTLNVRLISPGCLHFIRGTDISWHIYDVHTGIDRISYWEIEEEDYKYIEKSYIRENLKNKDFIWEGWDISLSSFLNYLTDELFLIHENEL